MNRFELEYGNVLGYIALYILSIDLPAEAEAHATPWSLSLEACTEGTQVLFTPWGMCFYCDLCGCIKETAHSIILIQRNMTLTYAQQLCNTHNIYMTTIHQTTNLPQKLIHYQLKDLAHYYTLMSS